MGQAVIVENLPGNELDEVVTEGDASTSIKDGRVAVTNEIGGHHLAKHKMHYKSDIV